MYFVGRTIFKLKIPQKYLFDYFVYIEKFDNQTFDNNTKVSKSSWSL